MEVFVEPFKENEPGDHVLAAIAALEQAGLEPDMGPFATTTSGDLETIAAALSALTTKSFTAGASKIRIQLERQP